MLIDLLKQAYEAMQYNRRRTIITVAGMAWGIATVVLLTQDDLDRLSASVAGLESLTATVDKDNVAIQNDLHTYSWHVEGSHPAIAEILNYDVVKGRYYTEQDNQERNHVAVLGWEAANKLFSGIYPIGQRIRVGGISFTVIGV